MAPRLICWKLALSGNDGRFRRTAEYLERTLTRIEARSHGSTWISADDVAAATRDLQTAIGGLRDDDVLTLLVCSHGQQTDLGKQRIKLNDGSWWFVADLFDVIRPALIRHPTLVIADACGLGSLQPRGTQAFLSSTQRPREDDVQVRSRDVDEDAWQDGLDTPLLVRWAAEWPRDLTDDERTKGACTAPLPFVSVASTRARDLSWYRALAPCERTTSGDGQCSVFSRALDYALSGDRRDRPLTFQQLVERVNACIDATTQDEARAVAWPPIAPHRDRDPLGLLPGV